MSDKSPAAGVPPVTFDDDNPEWTDEDFARAKPADQMLKPDIAVQLVRKTGRPNQDKVQVTLRIDRTVLERFKAEGPGWQTRINEALRKAS